MEIFLMTMRKDKCIQRWIEKNPVNQVIVKLLNSKAGKLTIACSLVNPLTRRLAYLKDKIESGKCQLGYATCVKEVEDILNSTTLYIEDFLAIFYKKDCDNSIRQLREILEEVKQIKSTPTN
jgi:hypothetical protein